MQEESLMQLLDEKLRMPQEEIVLQTLYVIVNISTGNERHKAAIIKHPTLLQHILNYMVRFFSQSNFKILFTFQP
jgi:hypothetical protein